MEYNRRQAIVLGTMFISQALGLRKPETALAIEQVQQKLVLEKEMQFENAGNVFGLCALPNGDVLSVDYDRAKKANIILYKSNGEVQKIATIDNYMRRYSQNTENLKPLSNSRFALLGADGIYILKISDSSSVEKISVNFPISFDISPNGENLAVLSSSDNDKLELTTFDMTKTPIQKYKNEIEISSSEDHRLSRFSFIDENRMLIVSDTDNSRGLIMLSSQNGNISDYLPGTFGVSDFVKDTIGRISNFLVFDYENNAVRVFDVTNDNVLAGTMLIRNEGQSIDIPDFADSMVVAGSLLLGCNSTAESSFGRAGIKGVFAVDIADLENPRALPRGISVMPTNSGYTSLISLGEDRVAVCSNRDLQNPSYKSAKVFRVEAGRWDGANQAFLPSVGR